METGTRIDYKTLRKINPQTERIAVLEYLKTNRVTLLVLPELLGFKGQWFTIS